MQKIRIIIGVLIVLAIALNLVTAVASAHGDPTVAVTPDPIAAGGTIHVKALMVSPGATIVVTLESPDYRAALGTAKGDDDEGGFEADFTIPSKAPAGAYQVRVLGPDGRGATANLKVLEAGSTSNAKIGATQLVLGERSGQLVAHLQDTRGAPMAGQTITFTQRATFGTLTLGASKTDANGNAAIDHPNTTNRETEIGAEFPGTLKWSPARGTTVLHQGVEGSYTEIPASLITPNPPDALRIGIGLLVLGVWSVYAFAVYNLYRLWQDRGKKPVPET